MKFSLFLHIERYDEQVSHRQLYEELLALCDLAEEGGFDKVWIGEHHSMEYTAVPNPLQILAAVAGRTQRIRLGAGTLIAPFWHPVRLAGEAALLDVISNGRAEIGIARGAYQFEFDRMLNGAPATSGGAYLREQVPAVRALWQGDYAHDGEIWQFPTSTSVPKPIQQPTPPVWIAARDPDSHRFAVANGCNVMVTPLAKGDVEVADLINKFDTACAENPEVPRPQVMVLQHAYAATQEAELQRAAEGISYFYRMFGAWFANRKAPVNGFHSNIAPLDMERFAEYAPDAVRANMPIGTPEEVVARLKSYEAMGVDEYSIWVDSSLSFADKKANVQRFIADVLPAFAKAPAESAT
ncbi:MAG TPA: LLM class flavin-dependent oxidoreductase [Novosphingobium sp.]|nr:LLM class flavin-dependent oxidoreductase [Novosphingobium sp.]